MNRVLFALALGVFGLGMMGCAVGEVDPVPPTPAPEEQRDPPKQALNAELRQPQLQEIANIDNNTTVNQIGAKQLPPIPQPIPEAAER